MDHVVINLNMSLNPQEIEKAMGGWKVGLPSPHDSASEDLSGNPGIQKVGDYDSVILPFHIAIEIIRVCVQLDLYSVFWYQSLVAYVSLALLQGLSSFSLGHFPTRASIM